MSVSDFLLKLEDVAPATIRDAVLAKKGNVVAWPVLKGQSIASVEIPVGTWRAPHLHTNTSEIAVIVRGNAIAGILTPSSGTIEFEVSEGDCVFFPQAWPHWLRNTGSVSILSYFNYAHERPETIEIAAIKSLMNEVSDAIFEETE